MSYLRTRPELLARFRDGNRAAMGEVKALLDGWPRISSAVFYPDARAAIDWLCRVFDFELRRLVEKGDGQVAHSELVYGDGVITPS